MDTLERNRRLAPRALASILTVAFAVALAGAASAQTDAEQRVDDEVAAARRDASTTADAAAGAPRVAERYQSSINRGWNEALAGKTPAFACAGLKGRIQGTGAADAAAVEALFACNVLLPVRYFETILDAIESGDKRCIDLMTSMTTQLSAMTLSLDSIGAVLDAVEEDPETGAGALVAALGKATVEQGVQDPKRVVKDQLAERVQRQCPDLAAVILR